MKAQRLALGIIPFLLAACAADSISPPEASEASPPDLDPNDAYGDARDPVPGGAKIVPVEDLYALMNVGRPDFLTAVQMKALDARADAERIEDDATLASYLGSETDPSVAAIVAANPALDARLHERGGFVTGPTGGDRGGHAVHAVGWIPNSQLPPTVASANGGGYFVVKNSWGRTRADQGYYYVPFDWMVANLGDVVIL